MNKRVINFTGKTKIFIAISLSIFLIGIICNFIFGTTLHIQFTGGTILKYTYVGEIKEDTLKDLIQKETAAHVTTNISKNLMENEKGNALESGYVVEVQFAGQNAITPAVEKKLTSALQKDFSANNFKQSESSSVEASMGTKFFIKCLVAVAIAGLLMVLYVAWRFKKIGGMSAGVMALVALLHDVVLIYFTFVIFRMPIDSNFIAVVLMIFGYSLNDTIIIYDRVRENRGLMGRKADVADLFNTSCTQVLRRTICTVLTTLIAITSVCVAAIVFNLSSVLTFALPMSIGVLTGCYSSICIAGPLWVMWQHRKEKQKAAIRAAAK